MDLAEIRFIRKAFMKERGAQVFRKIRPPPILWEPIKDSAPPRPAVGYSETNFQLGNEIHLAVEKGSTVVSAFLKAEICFPILCEELPVYSHWSQHRYRHQHAVANIEVRSLRRLPTNNTTF
jgi:hypothetical protein